MENVIFGIKCLLRKLQTSYTLKNRLPKTSIPDLRPGVLFSWYVNRWGPTTRPVGIEASRDFHPNQTSDSIQVLYLGNLTKKQRTCFSFVYWFKEPFPEKDFSLDNPARLIIRLLFASDKLNQSTNSETAMLDTLVRSHSLPDKAEPAWDRT